MTVFIVQNTFVHTEKGIKMKREEEFDGNDKAAIAGFLAIFVIVGIVIGMALMYGWLAINHQIIALEEEARCIYDSLCGVLYVL
jgi:hypothetical protein